jgi:DNA-binding CsgD family transcriptional regulator
MSAQLSIQVFSTLNSDVREIEFFHADDWTIETESQLFCRVQELISIIRPIGTTLHLTLNIGVTDPDYTIFRINKILNNDVEINHHKLTVREIEILGLIMQGYTSHKIAEKLFISYETIKSHRKNILEKTGAKNTAALINYYHQTFFDK